MWSNYMDEKIDICSKNIKHEYATMGPKNFKNLHSNHVRKYALTTLNGLKIRKISREIALKFSKIQMQLLKHFGLIAHLRLFRLHRVSSDYDECNDAIMLLFIELNQKIRKRCKTNTTSMLRIHSSF